MNLLARLPQKSDANYFIGTKKTLENTYVFTLPKVERFHYIANM